LKSYMEKVFPDYDKERVYVSDMKKLFTWYNQLHDHKLLVFDESEEQAVEVQEEKIEKE
jgi:hypothetical protein